MSIPSNSSTYDIVGAPRRPSLDDCGGAGLLDDAGFPPDPLTMPAAIVMNQGERQIAAAHQTLPVLAISFRVSGGNLVLDASGCMSSIANVGAFTITPNAAGDTSVTWPANTFPPALYEPFGGITGATGGMIAVEAITNGIRIRTWSTVGAATTLACTVYVG